MSTEFSSLEKRADAAEANLDDLAENVVDDLITYSRGTVVANEQQFVLAALGKTTGWMRLFSRNVNTVLLGPAGCGKSHLDHALNRILPSELCYETSDASGMAIVDDSEWPESLVAPLDEWQKLPDQVTEIVKSVAGEDVKYQYKRSVSDDDADSGRSTTTISRYAMPYSFLYAQFSMDDELWDRLLKCYIADDERIHKAIGKKEAGHEEISVEGFDHEYVYDVGNLAETLRQHFREMPTTYEQLEGGDEDDPRLLGDAYVEMEPWVWAACEPVFPHAKTAVNRTYGMVFNLIRASTVLNYRQRETVTVSRDVDGETGTREVEGYLVEPQDVANVLSTMDTLLGTTHGLEPRKRAIVDCLQSRGGLDDDGGGYGLTIDTIRDHLKEHTSMSVPKKNQLREILDELDDEYFINVRERAGDNGAHLYEFRSMAHIGVPRTRNLDDHLDDDQVERCHIDLSAPFADTRDPFRDQPFETTVNEFEDEFTDDPVQRADRRAELAAATGDDDADFSDDMGDGLAQFAGGRPDVDLGPLATALHGELRETAHEQVFKTEDKLPQLLDVCDRDTSVENADVTDSLLDQTHSVWGPPVVPSDADMDRSDVVARLEEAMKELDKEGVLQYVPTESEGFIEVKVAPLS